LAFRPGLDAATLISEVRPLSASVERSGTIARRVWNRCGGFGGRSTCLLRYSDDKVSQQRFVRMNTSERSSGWRGTPSCVYKPRTMSTETLIRSDPVAPIPLSGMDAPSQSWIDCFKASGNQYSECLARLHALLLRVARHEAIRRGGSLRVHGPEIEDIAQQAADDALMAIRGKVASFRGESRFTTWAYRFVVLEVSTKIGRHFWRHPPVYMDQRTWDQLPDPLPLQPEHVVEFHEVQIALRRAIEEDLTAHQRRVFVAVALNEVPMDAVAREIGSNRNAVYKTLFDARRRLRVSLAAAGYARPADTGEST